MLGRKMEVGEGEAKPVDKLKPLVSLLSITPNIVLIALAGSITLYWLRPLYMSSNPDLYNLLYKAFTRVFTFLGNAYSPASLDIVGVFNLAMLLIFTASLTNASFTGLTVAGLYGLGIIAYLLTAFLTVFGVPSYVYGYGIGDIFIAGLLFLVSLSKATLGIVKPWSSSQLSSITILFTVMTLLALLSMWIDKKQSKIQGARRVPEKTLVKYSALGGGFGIIAGAIVFRHKTLHKSLLTSIVLATVSSLYILLGGF